jgi:phosphohistidine phosphatase
MVLYLVRHGIAMDPADPKCPPDPERRLTVKGITKVREVADGLKDFGAEPTLMISSPYLRALDTAELFAGVFKYPKDRIRQTEALLPGASPSALFRELARFRARAVMCFGHAPNLDHVLGAIVGIRGPFTALKKSGVACLEVVGLTPPRAILLWLSTPKQLRTLAR